MTTTLGLLRNRLEELNLSENTIFIFMTDNGTAAGAKFKGLDSEAVFGFNAGMRGKKSSIYDGGHRVPFFVHWPQGGLTGGKDVDTLAAHIDVLPTLADLCGIAVDESYGEDGLSIKPLLEGAKEEWPRKNLVVQFHGGAGGGDLPPEAWAHATVLSERWRLVNAKEEGLFDIEADPAQRNDLHTKHPQVVAQLKAAYEPFWKKVSPRMTPVAIDLGNPNEARTVLCSQDWYLKKGNPPWNFATIKKLPKVTGPWKVEVQRAGRYRLTLRQWPLEADRPVVAKRAKLEIAGQALESPVEAGTRGVVFELDLPAGPSDLITYLYDKKGKAGGAYFTDVEWLGESASE